MIDQMMRAIRLDPTLYRQVADDPAYNNESVIIAVVVAFVAALGSLFGANHSLFAFISRFISELLFGWILWAVIAYFVGTNMFHGRSSIPEMLRVLAFAGIPRLLGIFSFIPCIGWIFAIVGWVLSIIAGVIAIRESMEFDTNSAIITAVIGLVLYIIISIIIGLVLVPFSLLR